MSNLIMSELIQFCKDDPSVLPEWKPYSRWDRVVHQHDKDAEKILEMGYEIHPFYGKCFNIAGTLHYMLGGKPNGSAMMKTKRVVIHEDISTTHWLVKFKGEFLDPTAAQFEVFGIDITKHYGSSVNGYMGRPYFKRSGKWYGENVPTKAMIDIGRAFKKQHGTAYGLDWWLVEEDIERNFL
jgi:hypothetical protein